MHISDGVLSGPVLTAGFIGAGLLAAATMRKVDMEEVPKISVITAVFFVASLIHLPVGVASVHLILNGLVGVVLGWRAFPAIMIGVLLQTIIFGHGGISVLGVNWLMLGGGALGAYMVWQLRHHFHFKKNDVIFGALAGGTGILVSGMVLATAMALTGEAFLAAAGLALAAHVPVMIVEAVVTGACVGFLLKTKPEVLAGHRPKTVR